MTRKLLNQDRIANLLRERLGFEVVDPSAMTLADQVRAFRDAEVVVGPHGAGLANTLFAARPAMLVEMFHSESQIFYHSLCYALQARHHTIAGTRVSEDGPGAVRGDNADYFADEGVVLRALEALLRDLDGHGPEITPAGA